MSRRLKSNRNCEGRSWSPMQSWSRSQMTGWARCRLPESCGPGREDQTSSWLSIRDRLAHYKFPERCSLSTRFLEPSTARLTARRLLRWHGVGLVGRGDP